MVHLRARGGRTPFALSLIALVATAFAACTAARPSATSTAGAGAGLSTATSGATTEASATGGGGLDLSTGASPTAGECISGLDEDQDYDGWTVAQGDCNDCDPNVNPAAVEVIAPETPVDEDCNGVVDDVPAPCDDGLATDDPDPMNAARAVDLCQPLSDPKKWGVRSAAWVLPDGSSPPSSPEFALGHGLLSAFGPNVNVQGGKRMLALSSGTARQPSDPDYQSVAGFDKGYLSNSPMGFPKQAPACPGIVTGHPHDGAALEITIRTPSNAHAFSFRFNFFTFEWPEYICSTYNDVFVALLSPVPEGQADGNISFDSQGNPLSVNNAFVDVCGCNSPPCMAGGRKFACALGDQGLVGTGFGKDTTSKDHGSTSWLVTKAPVVPSSDITLRWAVYDSADGVLDTTTLIDAWEWIAEAGASVGTAHVETPR